MNEDSILTPDRYPDVWAELARWIVEMEQEAEEADDE